MKRAVSLIIGMVALICIGVVIRGGMRAALIEEIADSTMSLVSDTTATSDFDAKLYELAYSSPVAPEKLGLWLEAVLAREFETFSANGNPVSPKLAKKLRGWPLNITTQIDLSGSNVSDEVIAMLGKLPKTEWVNLTETPVTEKALISILKQAPNLEWLQLEETGISWDSQLAGTLIKQGKIKKVDLDERALDPEDLNRLRSALSSR